MKDIADIMKKYHGYMCGWSKTTVPSRLRFGQADYVCFPDHGITATSLEGEKCIEYSACFLPGLQREEEKVFRTHIEAMFDKMGVVVLNSINRPVADSARAPFREAQQSVKDMRRRVQGLGVDTSVKKISFNVPERFKDGLLKVVDGVHACLTCPEREFVADNIRNIVVGDMQPS